MINKVSVVLVLCLAFIHCKAAKFPTNVEKCKFEDNKCIEAVANSFFEKFQDGHPGINLPSLDPMVIDAMDIVQGGSSSINVVLNFRNVKMHGLSNSKFTKITGFGKDPKNNKIEMQLFAPLMKLIGGYKVKGRVLVLPIQGEGKSNLTMANLDVSMKFATKSYVKNGKEYMMIDSDTFKSDFETSRLYSQFSNLFNGDKLLSDNMNLFLNENWQDILKELKPAIKDAFGQIFLSVINNAFAKVPYKDMFLDN